MCKSVFFHQLFTLCAFARAWATQKRSHVLDIHPKSGASFWAIITMVSRPQCFIHQHGLSSDDLPGACPELWIQWRMGHRPCPQQAYCPWTADGVVDKKQQSLQVVQWGGVPDVTGGRTGGRAGVHNPSLVDTHVREVSWGTESIHVQSTDHGA